MMNVSMELFMTIIGHLAETPRDKKCQVGEGLLREIQSLGGVMGRKNCHTGVDGYETQVHFAKITFRHIHSERKNWE